MTFDGQYLNYEEYQRLGGTLREQNAFNLLEYEARKKIDERTFGRLKGKGNTIEEVKICELMIINMLEVYNESNTKNKGVTSESVGSYRVSYSNSTSEFVRTKNIELEDIIFTYLTNVIVDGVPVLYLGVC